MLARGEKLKPLLCTPGCKLEEIGRSLMLTRNLEEKRRVKGHRGMRGMREDLEDCLVDLSDQSDATKIK
jgi:hypothetical protein